MDNKIEIFKNEQFGEVRTILIGDEPWFAGKDVALVLRYARSRDLCAGYEGLRLRMGWRSSRRSGGG